MSDHSSRVPEHHLKVWPPYYEHVVTGVKRFEVRPDDRRFEEGDMLHLQEWDPYTQSYTGRHTMRTINYIIRGGAFGIERGYVVLGIA